MLPTKSIARIRFTSGTIEALKWFALACMVVDHTNAIAFDRSLGLWAEIVGRFAMPIFALVFGYNLARPGVDRVRVAKRIGLVACLVTPLYALALGAWPLNVLFTLALAALLVEALERRNARATIALVLASCLVDYFAIGCGLVVCGFYIARQGLTREWQLNLACVLAALCVLNGNVWALLALPPLWTASRIDLDVPRSRWAFLAAYPAHLVAIAMLAGGVGAEPLR